jgi:hypothetical protein
MTASVPKVFFSREPLDSADGSIYVNLPRLSVAPKSGDVLNLDVTLLYPQSKLVAIDE